MSKTHSFGFADDCKPCWRFNLWLCNLLLIAGSIPETRDPKHIQSPTLESWRTALRDRRLQIYLSVNSLLTLYIAQTQTTLPLYYTNFVHAHVQTGGVGRGFAPI
jgi:hypothetical protein